MKIRFVFVLLAAFVLSSCAQSGSVDPLKAYRKYTATQLYNNGEVALAKGNYSEAVKNFEALDAMYPFGQYNQRAQYDAIYAYYMNGDTAEAVAAADRYVHLYPRAQDVDYAYYMKALATYNENRGFLSKIFHYDLAQRDMSTIKEAYKDFLTLVTLYPNSRYAPDARRHLVYLRNVLAMHELQVARFYMQKQAYVAANNRASEVVSKFPSSPKVQDALGIIVAANRQLHLQGPANDALKVLKTNYPNSPVLARLAKGSY